MCLELRAQGLSYARIAKRLTEDGHPISQRGAWLACKRALDAQHEQVREQASHLVALQMERLDLALAAIMADVQAGDLDSIDRMLKIEERRARLKGLDVSRWPDGKDGQPTGPQVTVQVAGLSDAELELLTRLQPVAGDQEQDDGDPDQEQDD